jgi:hypothetical protein
MDLLNLFCQLPQIYWFERNIKAKFENEGVPASVYYQKLGKECQNLVGVPKINQVPITTSEIMDINDIPRSRKIEINEKSFSTYNHLTQKFLMLRQSAHKKYNDNTVVPLFMYCSAHSSYTFLYMMMKKYKFTDVKIVTTSVTVGFFISVCVGTFYINLSRTRAEKTAINSLKCYKCVDEMNILLHRPQKYPIHKNISQYEIDNIKSKLKRQGLICENHH